MARIQINTAGNKKKLAPTKAWVHIVRINDFSLFGNELLAMVSDREVVKGMDGYVVLWHEKEEAYRSVLTGVISQLAKAGVKRITVQHPRHMDDILLNMTSEKIADYGVTTARILMNNFDRRLFIRLSFLKGDTVLPGLLRRSIQTVKGTMAEA